MAGKRDITSCFKGSGKCSSHKIRALARSVYILYNHSARKAAKKMGMRPIDVASYWDAMGLEAVDVKVKHREYK